MLLSEKFDDRIAHLLVLDVGGGGMWFLFIFC